MGGEYIGKKVGDYTLMKHLGSGQFGDVYLGKKGSDNTEWAVKMIAKNKINNTKLQDMLKSEVAIMQQIDHRNVMHLSDFIQSESNYYLVMKICNNGDLKKWMESNGCDQLEEKEAVYFLQQIALGFRELHRYKVMHRDFKLDNLFMHDDTVIIADLGFAKAGQEMFVTSCGTPMYMAPEVFEGKEYTNVADLWSVGVTLYELLFGKYPFNAVSPAQLLKNIKQNQGPNLKINRSINDISEACEDLLRRILTYDTNERLTWDEFFNHALFDPEKQKKMDEMKSILNGMLQSQTNRMQVTCMWDNAKDDIATSQKVQKLNAAYQQHEYKAVIQNIDATRDESAEALAKLHDQIKLDDIYKLNSHRYEHEFNKIRFIFIAVTKLKELSSSFTGKPEINAIVLAYLVCAKKALVFINFMLTSLKTSKNLFALQEFDGWKESTQFTNTMNLAEKRKTQYDKIWKYLLDDRNNQEWNEEDNDKVIYRLDKSMDQNFIHTVINMKQKEIIQFLNDESLQDLQLQLLKGIMYLNGAQKSEEILSYDPKKRINWEGIYDKFDNANVNELQEMLPNLKKIFEYDFWHIAQRN